MPGLDVLTEDILYLILEQLDTARDRAHLAQTCRRLHAFMERRGWRAFARTHFPSILVNRPHLVADADFSGDGDGDGEGDGDGDGRGGWRDLANVLTWQSRAWDRRTVSFQRLLPRNQPIPVRLRERASAFRPALSVHFQADRASSGSGSGSKIKGIGIGIDGEEMLVWGAGEDLVARYRVRGRDMAQTRAEAEARGAAARKDEEPPRWSVLDGRAAGFLAGTDDVRTVQVVDDVVGEPDATFGRMLARFRPEPENDDSRSGQRVDQSRLYSVDVSTRSGIGGGGCVAAVTTPSHIAFYACPETTGPSSDTAIDVRPVATFAMGGYGLATPYNARWTATDGVLAVGVGSGPDPLRYLTVTPSGEAMELTKACRWSWALASQFALNEETRLLPTSLEPLAAPSSAAGGGGHLLLSGWRDGTVRLQDLRTPSPWDQVYQDAVMGADDMTQALLYLPGTNRFLAGVEASVVLRAFDLRWPRRYFHTNALPCSSPVPAPAPAPPPRPSQSSRALAPGIEATAASVSGFSSSSPFSSRSRWHVLPRLPMNRTTWYLSLAKHMGDCDMGGVWSLAHSGGTELAPASFYAGFSGGIVEGILSEDDAV